MLKLAGFHVLRGKIGVEPEINPLRYLIAVSNSETSSSVLSKLMVCTCSRMTSTISRLPMISDVLRASTAVAPHPFLATWQSPFSFCNHMCQRRTETDFGLGARSMVAPGFQPVLACLHVDSDSGADVDGHLPTPDLLI